jgi:arylsulfatase A-like enzyme
VSTVTRREFLSAAAVEALPAASSKRPNLLFIVADSWRGQALPSAGDANLIAPNLARLAREGVYCSRAYTSYPVCCPSRAAMLTGKFPHAAGVVRNHTRLPLDQPTMPAAMKSAGYRTGYIGKWHLDGGENPGFVPPERRRGFDYWAAYNVAHQHYDSVYFRDTPVPIPAPGFEPDYQTGLAIDFIRQESSRPFYLYLSWVAPHSPFTPPPRHATYDAARIRLRPNVPDREEQQARRNAAGYYGLCSAVDENLGRLLKEIDDRGLTGDTIVVFTSDHGHMLESHGIDGIDLPFEESSRIPLLIRYPRRLDAGVEIDALISNVDYAPTLLSLCGVGAPKGMQGLDLGSILKGGKRRRPESIYAEGGLGQPGEWRMVVRGLDKLVVNSSWEPAHLFDLGRDPYEMKNLANETSKRAVRDELGKLLRNWAIRTGERVG